MISSPIPRISGTAPRAPSARPTASPGRGRGSPRARACQRLLHRCPPRRAAPDAGREAEGEVVADAQVRKEKRVLEQHADAPRLGRQHGQVAPVQHDPPRGSEPRREVPADGVEKRGLADARGPHDGGDRAGPPTASAAGTAARPPAGRPTASRRSRLMRRPASRAGCARARAAGARRGIDRPGQKRLQEPVEPRDAPVRARGQRHRLGRERGDAARADEERGQVLRHRHGEADGRGRKDRPGEKRQLHARSRRAGPAPSAAAVAG
jgi:hypothetical protein